MSSYRVPRQEPWRGQGRPSTSAVRIPRPTAPKAGARRWGRMPPIRPSASDVVLVMLAGAAGGLVAVGFELVLMPHPSDQEVRLLERAAAISSALPQPAPSWR